MEQEFISFIKTVSETPNVYLVLAGDLINNATRSSVSNVFEDIYRPSDQKKMMAKILEPVKDRILCGVPGNHEARSGKDANDSRAVTIECASDLSEPYAFRPEVYNRLIDLCADICKRNGKSKLLWLGTLTMTEAYTPKPDEMVLSVHRWYQPDKSCPGNWLMSRMDELAAKVTMKLAGDDPEPTPEPASEPEPAGETCEVKTTMALRRFDNWNDNFWVKIAQEILIHRGHEIPYGADGYLGAMTQAILKKFQKEKGIPVTGELDGPTWAKLLEVD